MSPEYTLVGRDGVGNLAKAGRDTIRFMVVFDARRRGKEWIRLHHPWRAVSGERAARRVENEWLKKPNPSARVRGYGGPFDEFRLVSIEVIEGSEV